MRILILDYAGHIPQADLARKMGEKGHQVLHIRCTDYVTGNADFSVKKQLSSNLAFLGLSTGLKFNRYNFKDRLKHEIGISKIFFKEVVNFSPDFVILSNIPLLGCFLLSRNLRFEKIKYIFWWQDVYSLAMNTELKRRVGTPLINPLLWVNTFMEKYVLKNSHSVVAISDKFEKLYVKWNLDLKRFNILPNWSAPEDFQINNSQPVGITFEYFLYAGTLGIKHNPELLIHLADTLINYSPEIKIIVISEGIGRDFLERDENIRNNIILKDFVTFKELQNYLSSALGVIAILEQSASDYSVPSKIMTYFCAGKAIIAAIPQNNQVAKYILNSNSGFVVDPNDSAKIGEAAIELISDNNLRLRMENNSRNFAVENFSGKRASQFFLELMSKEN